jgi:hypothetical protein
MFSRFAPFLLTMAEAVVLGSRARGANGRYRPFAMGNHGSPVPLWPVGRAAGFGLQQCAFAIQAPTVAAEVAVATDNPVAWDNDGERIGAAGASDGTSRTWLADTLGEFSITDRGTGRNIAQRFPNPALERGALDVQRYIRYDTGLPDGGRNVGKPLAEGRIVIMQRGLGEALVQPLNEIRRRIAELDRAESLGGRGDQHQPEGRGMDGVVDIDTVSPRTVRSGRHAERFGVTVVKPAAGCESRLVDRASNRLPVVELALEAMQAERGGIGFWRHADFLTETAVQVGGAESDLGGQSGQGERFLRLIEQRAGLGHGRTAVVRCGIEIRAAAATRPEPRPLSLAPASEESHVLAERRARRTARPAVYGGCRYPVEEVPGGGMVASGYGDPAGIGDGIGMWLRSCDHNLLQSLNPLLTIPDHGVVRTRLVVAHETIMRYGDSWDYPILAV